MEIQEILDYIEKTPANTNPNVLGTMLQELGGSESTVETVTTTLNIASGGNGVGLLYLDKNLHNTEDFLEYNETKSLEMIKNSIYTVYWQTGVYIPDPDSDLRGITTQGDYDFAIYIAASDATINFVSTT